MTNLHSATQALSRAEIPEEVPARMGCESLALRKRFLSKMHDFANNVSDNTYQIDATKSSAFERF